jgi:hypothetical protein
VRNRLIVETKRLEKQYAEERTATGSADRKRLKVLFKRQQLGDMQAGVTETHAIRLRIIAAKAKDNDRRLMKYRVEERADADCPTRGFLRAAEVRAKRINIPALKRPHSTAKE